MVIIVIVIVIVTVIVKSLQLGQQPPELQGGGVEAVEEDEGRL